MRKDIIKKILYGYVQQKSISDTDVEKTAETFFVEFFAKQEYFKKNKEYYGTFPIEGDPHHRAVSWAMVRGEGEACVVLIHHNDVVGVEDFKTLKPYAFSPDELNKKLFEIKDSLSEETREDLESGNYLFGRGVCDMKGGGSIQMALLSEYANLDTLKGNVIVLGLPDEENLSAGMRAAVILLNELKEKYGFEYRLMINSEPHQRKKKEEGVFSFGSIGKLMPYVSIRGHLAHVGKVFEGFNPTNLMAEIVRKTEINMEFSDSVKGEAAPPPTWLYLRENKQSYDVSMPLFMNGCLSVLTLNQMPGVILERLYKVCANAFEKIIEEMNLQYENFLKETNQQKTYLPWKVKVVYFGELCQEAEKNYGNQFIQDYHNFLEQLYKEIHDGKESLITANFKLVEFVYNYIDDLSPRVVIGLVPPYYPNVANLFYENLDDKVLHLYDKLLDFTREKYHQTYIEEFFYTGISDLSYSCIYDREKVEDSLEKAMPFWGKIYNLPLKELQNISMPCVNIGPWGKDFHKLTERVYKEDLFERTPEILDYTIKFMLE
ncbi:M20/M25/M40 family metallo-hydrolase [Filifactor alocis]|uniref:M20/M25/M40 family metallo-hydrolase n=1 Tax=Filifactor alocis TaxID=143361 RepID=UPI003F9F1B02